MRPLVRPYKDRPIAATPLDQEVTWVEEGREFRAQIWDNPVWFPALSRPRSGSSRSTTRATTNPGYWPPTCRGHRGRSVTLYQDRRPMEQQIPLAAKPMVDAHRPFVWAKKAAIGCRNWPCWRVRSRTAWPPHYRCAPPAFGTDTPNAPLDGYGGRFWGRFFRIRPLCRSECGKKASSTGHLPKGAAAHRRQEAEQTA